jgi:hypothetical protein
MFKNKIAFGKAGYPWNMSRNGRRIKYKKGICPNAERIQDFEYLGLNVCEYEFTNSEVESIVEAFKKVWSSSLFEKEPLNYDNC